MSDKVYRVDFYLNKITETTMDKENRRPCLINKDSYFKTIELAERFIVERAEKLRDDTVKSLSRQEKALRILRRKYPGFRITPRDV